jgi:transposase
MASLPSGPETVYVGMDTSAREIVCGVLKPGHDVPAVERIPSDGESVRRLVGRLGDRRLLSVCYEAGPSGYELHRQLASMGVACQVIAPSLVPKGASDRVKTDRRDAVRLALALRAGMLTAVRVPSREEEAVRDLVRARGDLLEDRRRAQQRLNALLLRHGRAWRGGAKWTMAHRAWVDQQRFAEAALQETLDSYRAWLEAREAELRAAEARLSAWAGRDPLAPAVARLAGYRGIAELTALTLAAEVTDWHRFPTARAFMGFTGLVPSEYSSGARTRRGSLTKAGPQGVRTALVEAAQAYRHRPAVGAVLRRRQAGLPPATLARSWKAQQRLHATWAKTAARGKPYGVTAAAVARALAGFVWAEMTS